MYKFIFFKLSIIALILILASCEKENEDPNNGNSNVSDTRPVLYEGINSSYDSRNEFVTTGSDDPFNGIELHNPTSIGLIETSAVSEKKSSAEIEDEGKYYLYEVTGDTLSMIKGQQGNEITFANIERIDRINDTWMLFVGWITLETPKEEISITYEIRTDSIYIADTVSTTDTGGPRYQNRGDSIFCRADTTIYNDSLWIQAAYCYRDTLNYNSDTTHSVESANYAGLILNIKSGELYELGVVAPTATVAEYYGVEFHDYDPVSNKVFFWANDHKLGILDLNELRLELQELPIYLDGMGRFAVIDSDKILTPFAIENTCSVYVLGSGLRTKSNIDFGPNSILFSAHWRGNNNKRYLFKGNNSSQTQLFTMEFRNDSMIFEEIEMEIKTRNYLSHEEHFGDPYFTGPSFPEHIPSSFKDAKIYVNEERWVWGVGAQLWNYNEETKVLKVFPDMNWEGLTTDGEVVYYYDEFHKKVLHLDLESVTVSEVLDINNLTDEYLFEPGMVFKVSAKGNFLISCTRMYDFQKMVIEYDGTTGEKLSEWKQESAPLESIVSSLTQIF